MVSIKPAFTPNWCNDEDVNKCTLCHVQFGTLTRRHHCRACGQIYCGSCSSHVGSIPSYVPHVVESNRLLRMCDNCHIDVGKKKRSKKLILIFSLLPLTLKEKEILLYICTQWTTATRVMISTFKAIQYKSGYQKWSGLERRLLLTHWKEFAGHNRLMVQTIKGMVNIKDLAPFARYYKDSTRHIKCTSLYCDLCTFTFNSFDIFELIYNQNTLNILECPEMETWIGTCVSKLKTRVIKLFLPWLIQLGRTQAAQRIIVNYILPKALDNKQLAYAFYFECEMLKPSDYYTALQERLISSLSNDIRSDIKKSHILFNIFDDPQKLITQQVNVQGIKLPYDPDTTLLSICNSEIRQLKSYTKPWIIPLMTTRGKIQILQKADDLRKDRMVLCTMKILRDINEAFIFNTYNIFILSPNRGWVEMIPDTKTLYDLKKETIQNYVNKHNLDRTVKELRKYFLFSCASNCVLGYILGIGDRNLHNILILKDGSMAHIDFSYILGTDPKYLESTEMKLTSDMLNMLGGIESDDYKELKRFCSEALTFLRKYTYFWYAMFRYLCVSEPMILPHHGDLRSLQNHIETRLMPNASEEEIKLAVVKSVETNSDSMTSYVSDIAHSLKTQLGDMFFYLEV